MMISGKKVVCIIYELNTTTTELFSMIFEPLRSRIQTKHMLRMCLVCEDAQIS